MGSRASAYLVYGVPLEHDINEERFEDGLSEFVYVAREFDPDYPVDLVRTSTYDYPQYIVALPGSVNRTDWDSPMMVDEMPDPTPEKVAALMAWIAENGLSEQVDGDDGWYLAAMFG